MNDKKRVVIHNPSRFLGAEYARQDWVVNAEEGTTISDVLDPAYWAHVSAQMKPYDRVEVRLETGEWMLDLLVLSSDRNWARVHVLHNHSLVEVGQVAPPATLHQVKWRGPQHKHCVVRISDGQVLSANHDTADIAAQWLKNYEQNTLTS